jgi:hypothetical protein
MDWIVRLVLPALDARGAPASVFLPITDSHLSAYVTTLSNQKH